jgi:hypothetical protein
MREGQDEGVPHQMTRGARVLLGLTIAVSQLLMALALGLGEGILPHILVAPACVAVLRWTPVRLGCRRAPMLGPSLAVWLVLFVYGPVSIGRHSLLARPGGVEKWLGVGGFAAAVFAAAIIGIAAADRSSGRMKPGPPPPGSEQPQNNEMQRTGHSETEPRR